MPTPRLIALAGPNGAGKSTVGPALLRDALGVNDFVNADVIAAGLSAFAPETAALKAGRIMLWRMRELARLRRNFAFETTLAAKTHAPWIGDLVRQGYSFHVLFLWLPSAEFAVARVKDRVRLGGHDVPAETVRRRYAAGLRNLFRLYLPLASTWRVYNNAVVSTPHLIANGEGKTVIEIADSQTWESITGRCHED